MKFRPFSVLPDGFSICLYILIAYVASAASVYVLVNFLNSVIIDKVTEQGNVLPAFLKNTKIQGVVEDESSCLNDHYGVRRCPYTRIRCHKLFHSEALG
jgi:hypothetical protein